MRTLAVVMVAACSSPPVAHPIGNTGGTEVRSVACYEGTETETTGAKAHLALRRTLDPASGTITDDLAIYRGSSGIQILQRRYTVSGALFTELDREGHEVGGGHLDGPAWHWTAWHESVRIGGDEAMVQEQTSYQVTDRGLSITRGVTDLPADRISTALLAPLDCRRYDQRVDEMTPIKEPLPDP